MRFNPQANAVHRDTELQKMLAGSSMGPTQLSGDASLRSPLKTALILLTMGFLGGGGYWIWAEGVPGLDSRATAETTSGTDESYAVIQYAESLIDGRMEASLGGGAPTASTPQASARGGPYRPVSDRAQQEYDRGQALMSMGMHLAAAQHFAEAVRQDPQFAEAHYRLGLAYVQSGDLKSARLTRTRLARLDADLANLLGNLIND
jgi:tetratricopeptide (TPR) repeat protein